MTRNILAISPRILIGLIVLNSIEHDEGIQVGEIYCPIPQENFETIMIGTIAIKYEVT